jgi:hypothetical protein
MNPRPIAHNPKLLDDFLLFNYLFVHHFRVMMMRSLATHKIYENDPQIYNS